jgi:hypothetical protein
MNDIYDPPEPLKQTKPIGAPVPPCCSEDEWLDNDR